MIVCRSWSLPQIGEMVSDYWTCHIRRQQDFFKNYLTWHLVKLRGVGERFSLCKNMFLQREKRPPTPLNLTRCQVTLGSCTMQSKEFTGKSPKSSGSSPVYSAMKVRSLTLPESGNSLIPNFACQDFTIGLLVVVNFYNQHSKGFHQTFYIR